MDIQWYPGHMTKAKRQMEEDIKLVDLIIEIADARIPTASRNPDLANMGRNKARLIILNKGDLAEEKENVKWKEYFKLQGIQCILADSRNRNTLKSLPSAVQIACSQKIERDKRKGILNRTIKAMVVGIPNVGKSTFINSCGRKAVAKTGNKPGVTKGKQWVTIGKNIQLLDTPGVLWAKFEDPETGKMLAFTGSINDDILNMEELCLEFIEFLKIKYPGAIYDRYMIEENVEPLNILYQIGQKRGALTKGNQVSYKKAAEIVFEDYRSGRLGRITLQRVPGESDK